MTQINKEFAHIGLENYQAILWPLSFEMKCLKVFQNGAIFQQTALQKSESLKQQVAT